MKQIMFLTQTASLLVVLSFSLVSCGRREGLDSVTANMPDHIVKDLARPRNIVFVTGVATSTRIRNVAATANELARRGHTVAFAAPQQDSLALARKIGNFSRYIELKFQPEDVSRNDSASRFCNEKFATINAPNISPGILGFNLIATYLTLEIEHFYECNYVGLKGDLQANKPDLVVCDMAALACIDYCMATATPYVLLTTFQTSRSIPGMPTFIPSIMTGNTPYSVTYWERVWEQFLMPLAGIYYVSPVLPKLNAIRAKVGAIQRNDLVPSQTNRHIFIFNYFGLEIPRYHSPFLHMVGPVFPDSRPEELEEDVKQWLDDIATRKEESVVFMAFGTITKIEAEALKALLQGILHPETDDCGNIESTAKPAGKIHLLWSSVRNDAEDIGLDGNLASNVRIVKWVNQVKVLNHPVVKLFVSHGGLGSTFEANLAAKPILLLPGFGDQPFNTRRAEEIGYGLGLNVEALTASEVCTKARRLLDDFNNNATFRHSLEKVAKRLYHVSQNIGHVVDVIEMEMDVGSEHLRILEEEWPAYRLYNLDVLMLPVAFALAIIWSIRKCRISRRKPKKE